MKLLSTAVLLSFLCSFSYQSVDERTGKVLYDKYCVKCHGEDGTKGKFKAKNLKYNRAVDTTVLSLLKTGKKAMPSYAKKMTIEEMKSVISYTKTLRSR